MRILYPCARATFTQSPPPGRPCHTISELAYQMHSNTSTVDSQSPWLTAGSSYRLSDLKTQRKTLIEELGPTIPEVPIPNFLTNILPGLREGLDVDEIAAKLKASGHITDDGRWSCFPCDPAQVKKREEQCFQPLEQLAEAISTASGGGKHATPTLHAKPFHTTCLHAQGHKESSRWVFHDI